MTMAGDSWSSIPWTSFPLQEALSTTSSWYKPQVPYKPDANSLQTLDIWILNTSPTTAVPPPSSSTPTRNGIWIIYIHGGAWRDPLVDSTSFTSTVQTLLTCHQNQLSHIAGLASLNYTLSPHPLHPTHPTPPPDSKFSIPLSRNASHPTPIHDILTAISYLQTKFNFQSNYVLTGHSCGATLAFQTVMNPARFFPNPYPHQIPSIFKSNTILGLNGLYDLPLLITSPGPLHAQLSPLYKSFTINAFGSDESSWEKVSPSSISDWYSEWPEGKKVLLVQSKQDTLVPYNQTQRMLDVLRPTREGDGKDGQGQRLEVYEAQAGGDHNDLWKEGKRLAEILAGILEADVHGADRSLKHLLQLS